MNTHWTYDEFSALISRNVITFWKQQVNWKHTRVFCFTRQTNGDNGASFIPCKAKCFVSLCSDICDSP